MRTLGGALLILTIGCGGRESAGHDTTADTASTAGAESEVATSRSWLEAVPEGGTLTYEVTLAGGATRQVRMQVQQVVRRAGAIAVRLAPVGTPLDEVPVYPRWIVGENGMLAMLDETAALTEPGYAPIDDAGRMRTEAAGNVAWRLPRDWLTPGRAVPGEEVSAGWTLTERVGDVAQPVTARDCARLVRQEAGASETLLVCASVGLVEATTTSATGAEDERWRLVAIEPASHPTTDEAAETR